MRSATRPQALAGTLFDRAVPGPDSDRDQVLRQGTFPTRSRVLRRQCNGGGFVQGQAPTIFHVGRPPHPLHEAGRRLFLRPWRGRLGFFVGEQPLYRPPLDLIDRGLQQGLKPLNVHGCGTGEVIHRQPPLPWRINRKSPDTKLKQQALQFCSKLLTRNPVRLLRVLALHPRRANRWRPGAISR
jgi:hypothetical protein